MKRAQVEALLPDMPPQMASMIRALLIRPQTAVELNQRYCLSYRTQISKARARYSVPVYGRPTEGKPYYTYWLMLDEEPTFEREDMNVPMHAAINTETKCKYCGEPGPTACSSCREEVL